MARMTNAQMMEMIAMMQAQMQEQAKLIAELQADKVGKKSTRKNAPKPELVDFVKADGTTRKCTRKQADAWTKWRDGSDDRKEAFESMKAGWADKKAAYKPSKELVDAIKANRAAITRKVAKEEYGFIGSKEDLKALKDSICK